MPCLRGIDVSVFTQSEPGRLPEFPHPDASSIRLFPPPQCSTSSQHLGSSFASESDVAYIQKANARISVYIPSIPGSQFWMHYSVNGCPDPPCHLYFKLSMNGKNITSWGVKPAEQPSGSITRALYEPSMKWHCEENGIVLKREGIEVRYFHFLSTSESASVADDGGLIEVKVFRARGRKRRAPIFLQHRSQESYGIASPSGGLLDCPEEVSYYDWFLIDPKDSPFTSFRFHYRSWTNLYQLNLVSPNCSSSEGIVSHRLPRTSDEPRSRGNTRSGNQDCSSLLLTSTVDRSIDSEASNSMQRFIHRRPLPNIPETRLSGRKSLESRTPSITPSLLPSIEEDPIGGEDVEDGMASKPPICPDELVEDEQDLQPLPSFECHVSMCKDSSFMPDVMYGSHNEWGAAEGPAIGTTESSRWERILTEDRGQNQEGLIPSERITLARGIGLGNENAILSEGEWLKGSTRLCCPTSE